MYSQTNCFFFVSSLRTYVTLHRICTYKFIFFITTFKKRRWIVLNDYYDPLFYKIMMMVMLMLLSKYLQVI